MDSFSELLPIKLTVEEELEIERKCREPFAVQDTQELKKACSFLIKKTLIQDKLISKAMLYMTELEVRAVLEPVKQPRPRRGFLDRFFG